MWILIKRKLKDLSQDDGVGKHSLLPCIITSKLHVNYERTSFRTIRNRAEWKFYYYEIKKETQWDW